MTRFHAILIYFYHNEDDDEDDDDDEQEEEEEENDDDEVEVTDGEEGSASAQCTSGRVGEKPFRIFPVSSSTGAGIRNLWEEIKQASLLNSVRFDREGALLFNVFSLRRHVCMYVHMKPCMYVLYIHIKQYCKYI